MSMPTPSPASEAPRQLTVPLPPKIDPEDHQYIEFASSSTHLVLGCNNSVSIYSLPAFDLVDTISPGRLLRYFDPLRVYERLLVVICDSYESEDPFKECCFLYIWDLSSREHIGTVIYNVNRTQILMSVSLPLAETPDDGERSSEPLKRPRDPFLILCVQANGTLAELETYVLSHQDKKSVEGCIERTREPMVMTPAATICSVHLVYCLASMGRTALTGGWDRTVRAWDIIVGNCQMVFIGDSDSD
ncbi:hypothetical protein CVT26_007766, partial [Gymnopilus dilepis]